MEKSLEQQRQEYSQRRFIAMPLAGTIMWTVLGVLGAIFPVEWAALAIFIGCGSIVYLGIFISNFTGENYLDKNRPKNTFDALFLFSVGQALLVYAVAIPFYLVEPESLPLSVGILTGLMWIPLTWAIQHWVGLFHGLTRTAAIVALWYLLPELRFVAIPMAIVAIYLITLVVLEKRWRNVHSTIDGTA